MSFDHVHDAYLRWVRETFPEETALEQWAHFLEEVAELDADLSDAEEYADVMMLLCCVAKANGVDILDAFRAKFEVNRQREWVKTERGFRHK